MWSIGFNTRRFRSSLFCARLIVTALLLLLLNTPTIVLAEWSAIAGNALFYTHAANLFSSTRRSMLDGDPSEPVLENSVIGKGKDMVYEPSLRVMKFIPSSFGQTLLTAKVRGFVYALNPEFNETGVYLDGSHVLNSGTALRLRFYSSPDQLLGQTEVDHGGFTGLQDVRVTSHIGAVRFDTRLSEHWELQLYGRAGIRRFDEPFTSRNTLLWSIGPHLVWHMMHHARMVVGYHYERGLAEGRLQPEVHEDSSYVLHFATIGLEADVMEHLELELDFHYERVNLTTGISQDLHHFHGAENIFVGTGRLLYQVADNTAVTFMVQRANRSLNSEHEHAQHHNTNVGVRVLYRF